MPHSRERIISEQLHATQQDDFGYSPRANAVVIGSLNLTTCHRFANKGPKTGVYERSSNVPHLAVIASAYSLVLFERVAELHLLASLSFVDHLPLA